MKKKIVSKKIMRGVVGFCGALIVLSALYFSGVFNGRGNSLSLAFLIESARTGLEKNPATQLVFDSQSNSNKQLAENEQSNNRQESRTSENKDSEDKMVTQAQTPKVLFDISSELFLKRTNPVEIWTILTLAAAICLVLVYSIYKIYKKRKLQKIKK